MTLRSMSKYLKSVYNGCFTNCFRCKWFVETRYKTGTKSVSHSGSFTFLNCIKVGHTGIVVPYVVNCQVDCCIVFKNITWDGEYPLSPYCFSKPNSLHLLKFQ